MNKVLTPCVENDDLSSELERVKMEREKVRDRLNEIRPRRSTRIGFLSHW